MFLGSSARGEAPAARDAASARQLLSLYEEGLRHYNLGEYDAAIELFKKAYLIKEAPELLYNIAQSYRLQGAGNCAPALQFYRSYLRVEPATHKRASIEAAITDMERCARDEHTTASAPLNTEPSSPPAPIVPAQELAIAHPPHRKIARWIPALVGGAGLALALTGSALLVWARVDYDSIVKMGCAPNCGVKLVDPPRAGQIAGYALLGTGAVAGVAGLVIWLTGRRRASTQARLSVGDLGAGMRF